MRVQQIVFFEALHYCIHPTSKNDFYHRRENIKNWTASRVGAVQLLLMRKVSEYVQERYICITVDDVLYGSIVGII